jgi:hypothetical protein
MRASRPAFTSAGTRGGTEPQLSPRTLSLVQVQGHRLLGQRRPQPVHLRGQLDDPGRLRRLAGPARHRRGQRVQRALLATRQVCSTVERSTPHRSAASRWVHSLVSTATNISNF